MTPQHQIVIKVSVEFPPDTDIDQVIDVCSFFDKHYFYPAADIEIVRFCRNAQGQALDFMNDKNNPYDTRPVSYHMLYFLKQQKQDSSCLPMTIKQLKLPSFE